MRRFEFLLILALAACADHAPTLTPPTVHYVQEPAWQGDGVWFYPEERYDFQQTGIAMVYPDDSRPELTTDGEAFSQNAMAAAHQTLQLPAIVRVTDLDNGRQIVVRVNDRGPSSPHRVIALTRKAAGLLGIPAGGSARVRLEVDAEASHRLTEALGGGAPKLDISAAPVASVRTESLDGKRQGNAVIPNENGEPPARSSVREFDLPETFHQGIAQPGQLWIDAGTFSEARYAYHRRAVLGGQGQIERLRNGRSTMYRVKAGPFQDTSQADAALDQALRSGITDAHIVVEDGGGFGHAS